MSNKRGIKRALAQVKKLLTAKTTHSWSLSWRPEAFRFRDYDSGISHQYDAEAGTLTIYINHEQMARNDLEAIVVRPTQRMRSTTTRRVLKRRPKGRRRQTAAR